MMLWPHILNKDLEIGFCYTAFKWSNNAKFNAGVSCVIINLKKKNKLKKKIFENDGSVKQVNNINPYLVDGQNIIVKKKITANIQYS